MTIQELRSFFTSCFPPYVEVLLGLNDMLCFKNEKDNAEVYLKYSGGLDFSLQGIRQGKKFPTKVFTFRNQHELVTIVVPKVLELLDGVRRI